MQQISKRAQFLDPSHCFHKDLPVGSGFEPDRSPWGLAIVKKMLIVPPALTECRWHFKSQPRINLVSGCSALRRLSSSSHFIFEVELL